MADITYCVCTDCPYKDCDRHPSRLHGLAKQGIKYVSVAAFGGTCRRYLSYLVDIINESVED